MSNLTDIQNNRITSIDALRGIVMILMALDHTRDFFSNIKFDPLDLTQTNNAWFLMRWITHFCAPIFIFLAGIGAYLYGQKKNNKRELFIFLITRGIWLLFLEFTFVRFGWFFNFDYSLVVAQVIWAIGWSMIALSLLSLLSPIIVGTLGLLIILAHNTLDFITPEMFGSYDWLWKILHEGGGIQWNDTIFMYVVYPLIPWIGVIAFGYGFGKIYTLKKEFRVRTLLYLGFGMIAFFIILRYLDIYGEPHILKIYDTINNTVLSFIDCTKYPPSLLYILMTLGPGIVVLGLLENARNKLIDIFVIIGKVPLFYYLLHLVVIHIMALIIFGIEGADISYLFTNKAPWGPDIHYGFGVIGVTIIWLFVIAILFPCCIWFSKVKDKNRHLWWLSYF